MMRQLLFGVLISFLAFSETALAASFYTEPPIGTLREGDTLIVPVRLAVEKNECINAVDVVLEYSDNLNPVDTSIGKSILSLWLEQPTINKDLHQITFAGGIPNGYCGRTEGDPSLTNVLAEVVFRTTEISLGENTSSLDTSFSPEAWVSFSSSSSAYLNNGSGDKVSLRLIGSDISITKNYDGLISDSWQEEIKNDTINPEDFTIELSTDPVGKYWIIFNTSDKQTGISHYEVLEEPLSEFKNFKWGRTGASWIVAKSPFYLKDQSLNSTIWVKAVDKAGNETVATLVPKNNPTYKDLVGFDYSFFSIVTNPISLMIMILLLVIGLYFGFLQIKQKREKDNDSDNEKGNDEGFGNEGDYINQNQEEGNPSDSKEESNLNNQ